MDFTIERVDRNFIQCWLRVARAFTVDADKILRRGFLRSTAVKVEVKGTRDVVTDLDRTIEQNAVDRFRLGEMGFPDLPISGEELNSATGRSGWHMRIDPIDGTANFIAGIPLFCTILSLMRRDRAYATIVSDPILRRRWSFFRTDADLEISGFHAEFKQMLERENLRRVLVGEAGWSRSLSRSVVEIQLTAHGRDAAHDDQQARISGRLARLLAHRVRALRALGSSGISCALMAEGAIDAIIMHGEHTWDAAPVSEIAIARGAVRLDLRGQPWSGDEWMILTASSIADELAEAVKNTEL